SGARIDDFSSGAYSSNRIETSKVSGPARVALRLAEDIAMNPVLAAPLPPATAFEHWQAPIAHDLEEGGAILACALERSRPCLTPLLAHLRNYKGKRLRPALLLLSARACGRVGPAHHTLGAVVEMIHTATLVHDDVLDGAAVRRHVATV